MNVCRTLHLAVCLSLLPLAVSQAEPIAVRQSQGSYHGFLLVRSASGDIIAHGDCQQIAHGNHLSGRLTLHFRDGSLDEDTFVYTQDRTFHLLRDHHIQRGPFFKQPLDMTIDADGTVTTRSTGSDGQAKLETEHLDLPPDLANGIASVLLINRPRNTEPFDLSMVVPYGKGRLIKLHITTEGKNTFSQQGYTRSATLLRIKPELGGVAGVVAPVLGKQPADYQVWILDGEAPAILREVGQLYEGGPVVSLEMPGIRFQGSAPTH